MLLSAAPRWLGALAASALLAFAAAHAGETAAAAYTIDSALPATIAGTTAAPNANWKVAVSGAWDTQCPPTLENVALDGTDLRIDARSVLGLCARANTPFSIEVDPALALERSLPAGVYRVSFYAADGAQARPKLRAFALLDHSAPGAATPAPEAGFWWSTGSGDRTVLSLELQGAQLSVALMTYDAAGQPQWLFGATPFSGRTAHVALLRLNGGNDPLATGGGAQVGAESALTLDLEFHSAAHASAFLSRPAGSGDAASLRLRAFDVVRLPVAEAADGAAWQGDWVLVGDNGAQRLHFGRFSATDAEHFELVDDTQGVTLACTRDAKFPELPPSSCALRNAAGQNASLFDSVAVQRMDGSAAGGGAMHLLRITN